MSCVVEIHLSSRIIAFERLRYRRQKERVVLAPDRKQGPVVSWGNTPGSAKERNVAYLVQEQVELAFVITGPSQQYGIECVALRRHPVFVFDAIQAL
jgi:hypothetical protein